MPDETRSSSTLRVRAPIVIVADESPDSRFVAAELQAEGFELLLCLTDSSEGADLTEHKLRRQADDACAETLRSWPPTDVGMLGLGRGGSVVRALAGERCLGAAVSIWLTDRGPASLGPPVSDRAVTTPWLGIVPGAPRTAGHELPPGDVYQETVRLLIPGGGLSARTDGEAFEAWQRALEWYERRLPPRRLTIPYRDDIAAQAADVSRPRA